jgi:hypothetical protein
MTIISEPDTVQVAVRDRFPAVSDDLRSRLEDSRRLAEALVPLVRRMAAAHEEAVTLAVNSFSQAAEDDEPFFAFLLACGADGLGDALYDLAEATCR